MFMLVVFMILDEVGNGEAAIRSWLSLVQFQMFILISCVNSVWFRGNRNLSFVIVIVAFVFYTLN